MCKLGVKVIVEFEHVQALTKFKMFLSVKNIAELFLSLNKRKSQVASKTAKKYFCFFTPQKMFKSLY